VVRAAACCHPRRLFRERNRPSQRESSHIRVIHPLTQPRSARPRGNGTSRCHRARSRPGWWWKSWSGPVGPERVGGATREALREPTTEHVERCHAMALDRSGLLEVLDALKVADVGDRVRQATETVYQALIEASSPTRSAPRCTSARSRASTCVTVTAPASCSPRRGIGPRAARPARPLPVPPDERRQPCRRPGSLRILWRGCRIRGAGGGSKVRVLAQHRLFQRAQRGRRWRLGWRCATTSW
jgi:hypothetical protein